MRLPFPTRGHTTPPHAVAAAFVASAENISNAEAIRRELAENEVIIAELRGRLQAVAAERAAAAARADAAIAALTALTAVANGL